MLVYIRMSNLYEMWLPQEALEMASLSVNTQLNTTLHVSEGGCQNLWCHHLISRQMLSRNSSSVRGLFM
jgi:hypothetical protein